MKSKHRFEIREPFHVLWRAYGFIDGRFKLNEQERHILALQTRKALLELDPIMQKSFPGQIELLWQQITEAREYSFLWIWRFLFIWGWNGKRDVFNISFYKEDLETCIWSIGEY